MSRPRGKQSITTLARHAAVERGGITPLDFMLEVLRNEGLPHDMRMDAAKAAAPYCHARLNSIDVKGQGAGGAIIFQLSAADANI